MVQVFGFSNLHDATIADNADPVTHGQQLVVIGADKNDALVQGSYFVNQVKQGDLRSDVNALGRLIEDKNIGPGKQPAGNDDLLLISA